MTGDKSSYRDIMRILNVDHVINNNLVNDDRGCHEDLAHVQEFQDVNDVRGKMYCRMLKNKGILDAVRYKAVKSVFLWF